MESGSQNLDNGSEVKKVELVMQDNEDIDRVLRHCRILGG